MARVLSTALVLVLLAATSVAFAVTEGAKLERSPIAGTRVKPALFSPDGAAHPVVNVDFRLRKGEKLAVWIEDAHHRRVRTLVAGRSYRRGSHVALVWDGLSDGGLREPDGVYTPVVKLERSHRTIVLPNPIQLDTRPPAIVVKHPLYPILSPDGDHHHDLFQVDYRVDEPAHGILFVQPAGGRVRRVEFTLRQKPTGVLEWNGTLRGRPVRPGRYVLMASAEDTAGNLAKPLPFAIAQVRYVVLARKRVVVRPNGSIAIRVSTDAPFVRWRLHGRSGIQRRGTLRLRAPKKAGVYHLYVYAAGHGAQSIVVVA